MRRILARWAARKANQAGYAAILVAFLAPTVFLGCAAIAVDTANWYAQERDMQKAADAAALAGVPYLPYDLPSATTRAIAVAKVNGYDTSDPNVTVTVGLGARDTQLKVTISDKVSNAFGKVIGVPTANLTRSAVADYQGPQPMGSPCNTFGNEPTAGTGSSSPKPSGTAHGSSPFPSCDYTRTPPQFWANIEGPQVDKVQGDQFQDLTCSSGVDGCTSGQNDEYSDFGYVFVVKVQPTAVGTPVQLQLYDPEFAPTSKTSGSTVLPCGNLPGKSSFTGSGNANPWVTIADAKNRYSSDSPSSSNPTTSNSFCPGDSFPGSSGTPLITSFVLRHQVDSQNPLVAPVEKDTSGAACIKQFGGLTAAPTANQLTNGKSGYDAQVAQVFHNWTSLCTFTPDQPGDYYLQVRSNVKTGGTGSSSGILFSGNTAASAATGNSNSGYGSNAFSIRAVTNSGQENSVAVAGYSHMPISINADTATATFNLIRVLPGAAGHFIQFSYFDAGDAASGGDVKVVIPTDATGSITTTPFPGNCTAIGGSAGTSLVALSNCDAPFVQSGGTSKNNGKLETITIPIPGDYSCNYNSFGGCWYRVQMGFGSGSVHDVTTWNATVVGDPVRLIQ